VNDLDDPPALAGADPGGMLGLVGQLAGQVRDGYERGLSASGLPSADGITAVVVCGMGSSAMGGDILRSLFHGRLSLPIEVNRTPELPAYCGPHTLVVASSYSGGTAETLACFAEAIERGCRVVAVTSGGTLAEEASRAGLGTIPVPAGFVAPRSTLGSMGLALLGGLESLGVIPTIAADVEETATELDALVAKLGPAVPTTANPAKELAVAIGERVPVIWGADGISGVAASRWRTQFHENAKIPAFASVLPELDHNEVVGWADDHGDAFFIVALRHEGEHPDVAVRFPLSIRFASESGAGSQEVWAAGRSPLARLFSLVVMGDYVATYHALAHGVDPTPIAAIDRLKAELAGRG
jgi:glucose/mannose-6-phosphate isomerase